MNKLTLITIILVISIVYFAFKLFIPNENEEIQNNNQINNVEIIKPIDVIDRSVIDADKQGIEENKLKIEKNLTTDELAKSIRKSNREELIALKNNKEINYITLGEMIKKIQSQDVTNEGVKANLDRIKHNVEIAKKMAELTKRLHVEVDGKKEMDEDVYAQLLKIQKELILPAYNLTSDN